MSTHSQYEKARLLMEERRYTEALHLLREAEAQGVPGPDVEFGKGICLAALGRITEVRVIIRRLQADGHLALAHRLSERLAEEDPARLEPMAPAAVESVAPGKRVFGPPLALAVFVVAALIGPAAVWLAGRGAGPAPAGKVDESVSSVIMERRSSREALSLPDPGKSGEEAAPLDTLPKQGLPEEGEWLEPASFDLSGLWRSVDFVTAIDDFHPDAPSWQVQLYLKDFWCYPEGRTSLGWTWGDGWVVHEDGVSKAQYDIRRIGDTYYLFLPWLSGDVMQRGMKPKYYVLRRDPRFSADSPLTTDSTGPSAEPAGEPGSLDITGIWRSVDFVTVPSDFRPGVHAFQGSLFLEELQCKANGNTSLGDTWSAGWLYHRDGRLRWQYEVRTIGGTPYLFLPWFSGDVTLRGQTPKYYVMTKVR